MKPNEIQPGKIYKKKDWDDFRYFLGVGKRIMWEGNFKTKDSNFSKKYLVCLDYEYEGLICQSPKDCYEGYWEAIELATEFENLEDFYKKKFVDNRPVKP